jgi:hypothetical protein
MKIDSRPMPDIAVGLRDCTDFIMGSQLCRRALAEPQPRSLANFVRDLLEHIHRLQTSCHLPEFTDHGLSHLCSLVHRMSEWTVADERGSIRLVYKIEADEAAVLLLATLFHDIGMLSQWPEDLPLENRIGGIPRIEDIAAWVRRTHVIRMRGLVERVMGPAHVDICRHEIIRRAFRVGAAHQKWPEDWTRDGIAGRDAGLAALVAITDLLDEDAVRCDTATLVAHRQGNALNYAHWLRHSLTIERVMVEVDTVSVRLGRLAGTDEVLQSVYSALRNHFRLIGLYASPLDEIGVRIPALVFDPPSGIPKELPTLDLEWKSIRGLATQSALLFHLLRSFMSEALIDDRVLSSERIEQLQVCGLEPVDLAVLQEVPGTIEGRSEDEQIFYALLLPERRPQ